MVFIQVISFLFFISVIITNVAASPLHLCQPPVCFCPNQNFFHIVTIRITDKSTKLVDLTAEQFKALMKQTIQEANSSALQTTNQVVLTIAGFTLIITTMMAFIRWINNHITIQLI